jgi:hypothetical protein
MFSLLKFIIWIVGLIVVTLFVLNYFGYTVNRDYFKESKAECQKRLEECSKQYVEQGTQNAKCDFNCVNPKLIIKKK